MTGNRRLPKMRADKGGVMKQSLQEAQPGDLVVIGGHHVGDHARTGQILEVIGEPGHVRLRVRWEDDRETIFFPGADASIRHVEHGA
jgi:hypothetical protein